LGVVAEIADNVVVMYLGKAVEQSDAVTVFNNPKHPYTQALLHSIPKVEASKTRLDPIKGMVPSPYERPGGCVFHPRCNHAVMGICDQVVPPAIPINDNHEARCLIYDPAYADAFAAKAKHHA